VTSSMLSRLLPLLVSWVFWRKKPRQNAPETAAATSPEPDHTVNETDAARSREILKVLTLEREIIGTALTTIYESEVQGIITRQERDRLIEKYSLDLKELESRISEHQRIVDIFDLESAKGELLRSFRDKQSEIDKKLADLRSGAMNFPAPPTEIKRDRVEMPEVAGVAEVPAPSALAEASTTGTEIRDAKTKTEKKIEAIKEEVLKAMERLEQIESEG